MKFTFKKHPRPTGLARVGARDWVDIKLKGKVVGLIVEDSAHTYNVRFMVMGGPENNSNVNWRWVFFKKEHETLEAAKECVNSDSFKKNLFEKYTLHETED
jgi:hypothetical protein